MKTVEKIMISPELTGFENWLEGKIIDVEENKFNGTVISIKTSDGRIFFGQEKFFQQLAM